MSLSAAVIDAMVAAGCTAEQLAAAMKADLSDQEARKESKRANNAERQRRFKSRRRGEAVDDNAGNALPCVTERDPSLSPSSFPQTPNQHPHTHPDNKPARKGRGETSKLAPPAKPETVKDQTWADFLAHRKAKGAPLSETALAGIKREAEKAGWPLEAALVETMTRGWQAFKAEWVDERKPPSGRGSEPASYLDHYLAKQAAGGSR